MEYWHFNAVAVIYFAATVISLLLAYLSWRMRPVRGSATFTTLMVFTAIWVLGYTLGIYTDVLGLKLWLLRTEYIGMVGAVYFWVFFVARYTQLDKWLKSWTYVALAVIPVFIIVCVFMSPNETVVRYKYVVEYSKGISYFAKYYAWGLYLLVGYAYSMLAIGLILLLVRIFRVSGAVKSQLLLLLPVMFIVLLTNLSFLADKNIIAPYDPTPLTMVVLGAIAIVNYYSYKFLDVVPLAHNLIFKNMKSGVFIVNSKANVIDVNKVATDIIGKPEEQVVGKFIVDVVPEFFEIAKIKSVRKEYKTEISLGSKGKSFEVSVNPLTDNSGTVFGQVIMLWDITVQKSAMRDLDSYARTVAHDLKSPLSHIMGFAKLIDEGIGSEEDSKAYVKNIIISSTKMRNIVDGLLMLAKIGSLDIMEFAKLDMEQIIKSVCLRMTDQIDKMNVELKLPLAWDDALGNSIWIEEVWVNLISNAIKYGGNPPMIEIGCEQNGNYVTFWIKDNGQGIKEADYAVLFDEFSRVHAQKGAIVGYGLGLSIVQKIIFKLKGEVWVESTVGKGSTFYFTLPKAN